VQLYLSSDGIEPLGWTSDCTESRWALHWSNRSPRLDPHSLNLGTAEQPFKFQHVAEPQNTPNINGDSIGESSNTSNLDNAAQIQKLKERRLF
jgi:hypothetical protein